MTVVKKSLVLECPDGLPMAADVYVPDDATEPLPATVVCHGFKGFKDWGFFPALAERLAGHGRAVVVFNFSHGGVGPEGGETFDRLDLFREQTITRHVEDVGTVLDAIERGPLAEAVRFNSANRTLLGHSLGGSIAVLRAAEDSRIGQVATLNGCTVLDRFGEEGRRQLESDGEVTIVNARTGQQMPLGRAFFDDLDEQEHDIEEAAEQIYVPGLVIHAQQDETVPAAEGDQLNEWMGTARFVAVPGGHTFGAVHPFAGWTPSLEQVATELNEFVPWVGRFGGTS